MRRLVGVAALALGTGVFVALATKRRGFFDLHVYYGAIRYWIRDGGQLYDYLRPPTEYGFTYPPFAALTMLPMAVVPWPVAIVISALLTVGAAGLVLWWLIAPRTRPVWVALAVAACLLAAFEPMRETFLFGQINAVLLALVLGDVLFLRRFAGVGIGLATAIKLTPGIFILYLLVVGRWRAALVASGTAAGATLLAAAIAPDASRIFWTEALWNTDRIGDLAYISNQSLRGLVARSGGSGAVWLLLVAAVLAFWVWRVRRVPLLTGVALTGVVGGLISPVTWVHHLVWLVPALVLLVFSRSPWRLALAAGCYVILCSRLVWSWRNDYSGLDGFVFGNAYVWVSLALLLALPRGQDVADLGEVDRLAGRGDAERVAGPVGG